MEQAMEQRMANRIPWQSSDPAAILRVGERSALTLHRYNRDAAQLVRVGLDRNPFAAVLLNRLLLRRHLIAEDLKCHPLTLYFDPAGTHTSGFRVGDWQLQSAEPSSGKLITRVVGYDCESDCLILRADASDGS